jgi:uncharacterized protein
VRVGVISDTHGLLRPEAEAALAGCDRILHAGDIGDPDILPRLGRIAPVAAVRGNCDIEAWARSHPERLRLDLGGCAVLMLHDLATLAESPAADGIAVVVSGHTHRPEIEERAGILFLNPGSAGPRRFRLSVTLAILFLAAPAAPRAEIVHILG